MNPVATFRGSADVRSVAFSPDGSSIVAGLDDGRVLKWDCSSSVRHVHSYPKHSSSIRSVALNKEATHLADGSYGGYSRKYGESRRSKIRIWNY